MNFANTQVRCQFHAYAIFTLIEEWAGKLGTTPIRAAERLIEAAIQESVKVYFEYEEICVTLPRSYLAACRAKQMDEAQIIHGCLVRGSHLLDAKVSA